MKTRTIHNEADLQKASQDILNVGGSLPVVMTLTKGSRLRTTSQNQRYWATLDEHLSAIATLVEAVAEQTGYTPLEVRRLIAWTAGLPPEQVGILFARKKDVIHEHLKIICDIPTSTRLGTKEFMGLEDRMIQTLTEIEGEIRAAAAHMPGATP